MKRDIRQSELYREIEAIYGTLFQPGTGRVSDGDQLTASPDGRHLGFTGTLFSDLKSTPETRICLVDVSSGTLNILPQKTNNDKTPQWSPNGQQLAFLSDRAETGNYQLYVTAGDGLGVTQVAPVVDALLMINGTSLEKIIQAQYEMF